MTLLFLIQNIELYKLNLQYILVESSMCYGNWKYVLINNVTMIDQAHLLLQDNLNVSEI